MTDSTSTGADAQESPTQPSKPRRSRRATSATTAPVTDGGDQPPAGADGPSSAERAEPASAEQPAETTAPAKARAPRKSRAKATTETAAAEGADVGDAEGPAPKKRTRRTKPAQSAAGDPASDASAESAPTTKPARRSRAKAGTAPEPERADTAQPGGEAAPPAEETPAEEALAEQAPAAEGTAEAPAAGVAEDDAQQTTEEEPRSGRRSRRATAPARSPEQQLDVLKELGDPEQPAGDRVGVNDVDAAAVDAAEVSADSPTETPAPQGDVTDESDDEEVEEVEGPRLPATALLFQAPDLSRSRRRASAPVTRPAESDAEPDAEDDSEDDDTTQAESGESRDSQNAEDAEGSSGSGGRRRRRRGGRGRRNRSGDQNAATGEDDDNGGGPAEEAEPTAEKTDSGAHQGAKDQGKDQGAAQQGSADEAGDDDRSGEDSDDEQSSSSRRRRRRRRARSTTGDDGGRSARDEVTALKGSTRLEAKRQRRREGREAGRRRRDVITEAEFLARRESVDRKMVVREKDGLNQIAVLEDDILVEHYVAQHTQTSMVGNVYLGRVQNVLPSMEAAFVDLGKGRNAVLYAGEVNWDAAGMEGQPRRIEQALKSGDQVVVQVTKDPIGHKGARLTSQITLAGRYLVLVPSGAMTGISRKLPDTERSRLKKLLKEIVPEGAGVIVRTAAEGASEEQLRADVDRLTKQWAEIDRKAKGAKSAPVLLKGEPELAVRVVRDVFNEDFQSLTVAGDEAWSTISTYVRDLAPDLADRMHHWTSEKDVFAEHRIDEQLAKAMDRKVWLPSGGSLVIDRTEAMTVIDVNTGKFTGSGGTLEETVTRNNLEAAEEIVRQLRLRDIGGIIVIDFIDMVLESNRDLVLRRLVECLGRDRTRHQVAEVTSLGLVQMTRKRVGQGLVEAFSTTCEHCNGRGFIVHNEPVERSGQGSGNGEDQGRRRGKRGGGKDKPQPEPTPQPEAEDPEAAKAREAVKATLATIAAAAASAHEDEGEHAGSGTDRQAEGGEPEGATPTADSPAREVPAETATAPEAPAEGAVSPETAAPGTEPVAETAAAPGADEDTQEAPATGAATPSEAAPDEAVPSEAPAPVDAAGAGELPTGAAAEVSQEPAAPRHETAPAVEPAAQAEPAAPARRPRRSRRATSGGVVTAGDASTPAILTATQDGQGTDS